MSPPLVTQCHTSSTPSALLTCDVIYGCPLNNDITDEASGHTAFLKWFYDDANNNNDIIIIKFNKPLMKI